MGVVAAVLVVAVGDDAGEPVFVELLPQAANSTRVPKIRRQNMANAVGLDVFIFLYIVPLSQACICCPGQGWPMVMNPSS